MQPLRRRVKEGWVKPPKRSSSSGVVCHTKNTKEARRAKVKAGSDEGPAFELIGKAVLVDWLQQSGTQCSMDL